MNSRDHQNLLHSLRQHAKLNNQDLIETVGLLAELHAKTPESLEKFEVGKSYRLKKEYRGEHVYWTEYFSEHGTSKTFTVERLDFNGNAYVGGLYDEYRVGYFRNIHWYEEVV